ncbi:MAG TPA: HNH endonuclease signature motif containing protein [Rhodanobacter sp.]|nr:HNH endonuclease signature motif containing protein [Rhodanobacter sp.]
MAWSAAGILARNRVCNIVYGGALGGFDPFNGNTFGVWHPNGARIGFDQGIIQHVYANAPADNGVPAWYTCDYCNWEYPIARCHIDHVVPWADYSLTVTTSLVLANARAIEVWVGCNDPANLVVACDSCNTSKNNNAVTQQWINNRRALANANNGF